jgi:hypothetical protein
MVRKVGVGGGAIRRAQETVGAAGGSERPGEADGEGGRMMVGGC